MFPQTHNKQCSCHQSHLRGGSMCQGSLTDIHILQEKWNPTSAFPFCNALNVPLIQEDKDAAEYLCLVVEMEGEVIIISTSVLPLCRAGVWPTITWWLCQKICSRVLRHWRKCKYDFKSCFIWKMKRRDNHSVGRMSAIVDNEFSAQASKYRLQYHYFTSVRAWKMCGQLVRLTLLKLHAAARAGDSLQSITNAGCSVLFCSLSWY